MGTTGEVILRFGEALVDHLPVRAPPPVNQSQLLLTEGDLKND